MKLIYVGLLAMSISVNAHAFFDGSSHGAQNKAVDRAAQEVVSEKDLESFYKQATVQDREQIVAMIAADGVVYRDKLNEMQSKKDLIKKIDYLRVSGHPSIVSKLKSLESGGKLNMASVEMLYERDSIIKRLQYTAKSHEASRIAIKAKDKNSSQASIASVKSPVKKKVAKTEEKCKKPKQCAA